MYVGPMTIIVAAVLGVCLIAGLVFIFRAMSARTSAGRKVCRRCRNVNPARAKFCAHCGENLNSS